MQGTFIAQYHGECVNCGEELMGHESMYDDAFGNVCHVKCPDVATEAPADTALCERCWTYHKGECI